MKKLITSITCFIYFIGLGVSQNLELVYAEKFDFLQVSYESEAGFENPAILFNHLTDLSYFDVDFDPMGINSGSIFFQDDGEISYAGTISGSPIVRLLDFNLNNETDHQTILLELYGPCTFISPGKDDLYFDFPDNQEMVGIINYSDDTGQDSFWSTYMLATENIGAQLWTAGDMTLITGYLIDEGSYFNPDSTEVVFGVKNRATNYILAIDKNGFYKWSYLSGTDSYAPIQHLVSTFDEIVTIQNFYSVAFGYEARITHLDFSGNETKDIVEYKGLNITDLAFDNFENMIISGNYNYLAIVTNLDLNGGEYYLDEPVGDHFDAFIVQYDSGDNLNWVQYIKGIGDDFCSDIDIAGEYIYLTGYVSNNAVFGKDEPTETDLNSMGGFDVVLAKYLSSGVFEWARSFGTEKVEGGINIRIDNGEINVFGAFNDSIDVSLDPINKEVLINENPNVFNSFFLVKYRENTVSASNTLTRINYLSPNPANSYLKTNNFKDKIKIIKNLNGETLGVYDSHEIDVSSLPSGMYVVAVESNGEIVNQLISVIH